MAFAASITGVDRAAAYAVNYASGGDGTTGQASRYVPMLFAKKALRRFYATSAYQLIANTDYEGEIKKQGDQVVIRRAPAIAISDYTVGGTLSYEVPEEANVELDIDQAKSWAFRLDDIDAVASDLQLMNMFVENAQKSMQVTIDTNCLAYWAAGADADNSGSTAGAISGDIDMGVNLTPRSITGGSSGDAHEFLVDAEQVLREQNVDGPFWAVVPYWFINTLSTGDLRRWDITNDAKGVIRTGFQGEVNGMKIIANNNLPWDGTNAESTVLIGSMEALTFAMQLTKSEVVRIPDSFGDYSRGLMVFGREVVQPEALAVGVIDRA